ncbi:DNA/RNA non-specific endonuclease [Rhizobium leguminosarum]|uniref:DNA/RNA non-specific endonuclease n=1 Tax=Rhizobium ruizarguesonis TaxID=2081791 RepID=UPI0013B94BF2|nr:DNA/RNA non-specific endonuclease [Rhizobium ruizarguesonis]NEJ17756.1 DNA/RNA non-specific endonuclease [Rhizobium ruizarguesonis]NEK31734.1 DNA/RNA non-specific endonuclease [Rhizobium ruizarguesonis]
MARKTGRPNASPTIEVMERFIRAKGSEYLARPNVNSIGIGYKTIDGKRTDTLSIQFSVDKKVAEPQALGSEPIPEVVVFEGVTLPTDVVQRSFEPHYVLVQSFEKDPRKQRVDKLIAGVSVGNPKTSAGTLGAIVGDQQTGNPVMLSNWHVFNTPTGVIGDPIVQPGSYDDNRTELNRVGALLRSHLGAAGDCAIATIEARGFDPTILDIGERVGRIGKAELDDKVIKSGRTTGVTRGVVTRVSTLTQLNYGGGVVAEIGGFEIGHDPNHPAPSNEISKGGDSGSCWMAIDEHGNPTDVMLGLHFGGDGDGDDGEYALASQAHSVFEKLEIEPLPAAITAQSVALKGPKDQIERVGFDRRFIGEDLPLPSFTKSTANDFAALGDDPELRYCHFSVWLSAARKLPRFVAWNIDGMQMKYLGRRGLSFRKDERGDLEQYQYGDELYADNPFDRGHVARRADLCWGPPAEAAAANYDSFYFTNQTPQHSRFNQSKLRGKWGELENATFNEADPQDLKVSLLAGPILAADDPHYRKEEEDLDIQIPVEFWKVVIFRDGGDGKPALRGFVLTQRDLVNKAVHPETLELEEFRWFHVPIDEIGKRTGLRFGSALQAIERIAAPQTLDAGGSRTRLILTANDFFK